MCKTLTELLIKSNIDDASMFEEIMIKFIDEYDIYCNYLDYEPDPGEMIVSPLRKIEQQPSFNLFLHDDRVVFKDFASNKKGYILQFVKYYLEYQLDRPVSYWECIFDIIARFDGDNLDYGIKRQKELKNKPEYDILIKSMEFQDKALNYWRDYSITPKTLDKYNVSQVKYQLNADKYVIKDYSHDMCFAYRIAKKYKLYRPLADKSRKFRNNYPKHYVEGFLQVDKTKPDIIVTKSMKDVMVLDEMGYNAVSPKSETTKLSDKFIEWLRNTFDRIFLLFDNDVPGLEAAMGYPDDFIKFFVPENVAKDISDMSKFKGFKEAKLYVEQKVA